MSKVTVEAVVIWMVLSAGTGFVTYTLWRKGRIRLSSGVVLPVFVFYMAFVLTLTIVERVPGKSMQYELAPFWSYRAILAGRRALAWENFWNVVLFVPVGGMLAVWTRKKVSFILMCSAAISAGIEIVQLVTRRGLFEFDDMIHNTVGALVGMLVVLAVRRIDI